MYCYKCGKENSEASYYCASCGMLIQTPQPQQQRMEDNAGMRLLLPIGQSPLAMIAGYLGLFCVMLIPDPFAIILGVMAIRDIRANPGKKYGMGRAIFGIVMGVLCIVGFLAIIVASLGNRAGSAGP